MTQNGLKKYRQFFTFSVFKHDWYKISIIYLFYILFYISTLSTSSHALTLSQDIVVKKVLENSLEYRKIQASETKPLQNLAGVEAFLDWQFFVNADCASQE